MPEETPKPAEGFDKKKIGAVLAAIAAALAAIGAFLMGDAEIDGTTGASEPAPVEESAPAAEPSE